MITDRQTCFQFKASFSPCTILQITRYDLEALKHQLVEAIQRAPNFFIGSPVVVDLEKIKTTEVLNFVQLKQILIDAGLVPVGVRGGDEELMQAAVTAGFPRVTIGKTATAEPTAKQKIDENQQPQQSPPHATKLVATPIRSGMQVYAKEADLIVVGQVSPGAELLADGHIHVYGALRGRALAGVQGNTQARIFCRTLEAELVSIAGYYLTKEDMQTLPAHDGMIQIYLENEQVRIEAV
ncbi:MAG: septum site-determining protein MinC [Gammaproteobacteria bacterium]